MKNSIEMGTRIVMKARPLHARLLVRRIEQKPATRGGIIISAKAKKRPQEGEVLAVGGGKEPDDGTKVVLNVRVGDKVLFGKRSGIDIKVGGEDLLILPEDEFVVVST